MARREKPIPGLRGFTLVELLVVISVIALLIAILLPSLKHARAQAKGVVCAANSKQIALALFTYQVEFDGYVPHNVWSEYDWAIYPDRTIKVLKEHLWFYKLFPTYLGDPDVLICPADPFRGQFNFEADFPGYPQFGTRSNTRVPSCGYGLSYLIREIGLDNPRSFQLEAYPPKRPPETILFAEVGPDDELWTQSNMFSTLWRKGQPWRDGGRIVYHSGLQGYSYSGPSWLTTRHMGRINMTAMDGSVRSTRTDLPHLLDPLAIESYYEGCAAGNCFFCVHEEGTVPHYDFSHARMWWWTGPAPKYPPAQYVGQSSQL
jgi:prepilin-type N-terminal cleavage/methylation domain-containing protein